MANLPGFAISAKDVCAATKNSGLAWSSIDLGVTRAQLIRAGDRRLSPVQCLRWSTGFSLQCQRCKSIGETKTDRESYNHVARLRANRCRLKPVLQRPNPVVAK